MKTNHEKLFEASIAAAMDHYSLDAFFELLERVAFQERDNAAHAAARTSSPSVKSLHFGRAEKMRRIGVRIMRTQKEKAE